MTGRARTTERSSRCSGALCPAPGMPARPADMAGRRRYQADGRDSTRGRVLG